MRHITAWQDEALIDRLAEWIARRGLVTPAMFLLEVNKPFSFLGSQALWMLQPLLGPAMGYDRVAAWARLLEDRASVERLLERLESRRAGVDNPAVTDDTLS
jgi:hypothetical protein